MKENQLKITINFDSQNRLKFYFTSGKQRCSFYAIFHWETGILDDFLNQFVLYFTNYEHLKIEDRFYWSSSTFTGYYVEQKLDLNHMLKLRIRKSKEYIDLRSNRKIIFKTQLNVNDFIKIVVDAYGVFLQKYGFTFIGKHYGSDKFPLDAFLKLKNYLFHNYEKQTYHSSILDESISFAKELEILASIV